MRPTPTPSRRAGPTCGISGLGGMSPPVGLATATACSNDGGHRCGIAPGRLSGESTRRLRRLEGPRRGDALYGTVKTPRGAGLDGPD